MDQTTYDELAAAVLDGRGVTFEGRSAVTIADLNWIAKVSGADGLTLLNPDSRSAKPIAITGDEDSITVTKEQFQAALDDQAKPLKAHIESLQQESASGYAQLDALQIKFEGLQGENADLKTQNAALVAEKEAQTTQISALQAQNAKLTATIDEQAKAPAPASAEPAAAQPTK